MTTPDLQALIELLPCPFCGADAKSWTTLDESLWSRNIVPWTRVACTECPAEIPSTCEGGDPDAINAWNTRHAAPTLPGAGGGDVEYEFEAWQGGAWQAGGSTTTLEAAVGEASHYKMMYGQDGPVEVRYYEKRRIDAALPPQQGG